MTENAEPSEVSWYDITIAGRQFNIASRRGEAHIRNVENLIGQTLKDIQGLAEGQAPTHQAWLLALNLADQVLALRAQYEGGDAGWGGRLESMVYRLNRVLPESDSTLVETEKKGTAAVFEKPEFF